MTSCPTHPDRRVFSRGVCRTCYDRARRSDLSYVARRKRDWKRYYEKHGTKVRVHASARGRSAGGRAVRLRRLYDITPEQYDAMLARQNGGCALCGRKPKRRRLDVDHDHTTKRVRGLLCFICNKFRVGKNTAEEAAAVLAYLQSDFDGRNL